MHNQKKYISAELKIYHSHKCRKYNIPILITDIFRHIHNIVRVLSI